MKKALLIILIILLCIVVLYLGLLYHARMTASDWGGMVNPDAVIGEDGEYYIPDDTISDDHMVDGNFTYVDNDKLLERIVGDWESADGSYTMVYDRDYQMTIKEGGVELLATKADFRYLQPGEVTDTDFMLELSTIKDTAGNDWGEVEYCYHYIENEEDVICMSIYLLNVDDEQNGEIIMQFKKAK